MLRASFNLPWNTSGITSFLVYFVNPKFLKDSKLWFDRRILKSAVLLYHNLCSQPCVKLLWTYFKEQQMSAVRCALCLGSEPLWHFWSESALPLHQNPSDYSRIGSGWEGKGALVGCNFRALTVMIHEHVDVEVTNEALNLPIIYVWEDP